MSHVYKTFGSVQAVRGVSFGAAAGRVTALLGPNGAGKTTTIRMITGFVPPDRGRITVEGFDTLEQSRHARGRIGYMPENTPLYPEMSVRSLLSFRGKLFGLRGAARKAAVDAAISRCWLDTVKDRRIGTLSKGFKQRVGLAAALLHGPRLLILDEPTNGLDPEQVRQTRTLIRELAADRAVLITSHVLAEVELVCDHVVIIAGGEVKADGTPRSLIAGSLRSSTHIVQIKDSPARPTEAMVSLLCAVAGVKDVAAKDSRDGWTTYAVSAPEPAADLREPIAAAAAHHGLLVRELRRESPNLESLFLELIGRGR